MYFLQDIIYCKNLNQQSEHSYTIWHILSNLTLMCHFFFRKMITYALAQHTILDPPFAETGVEKKYTKCQTLV